MIKNISLMKKLIVLSILIIAIQLVLFLELSKILSGLFIIAIFMLFYIFLSVRNNPELSNKSNNSLNSELLDDNEVLIDQKVIEPLQNILDAHKGMKFFSMALIGEWGSGKSSHLKTLQKKLDAEYEIIYINVWELEDSANIVNEVKKEFDDIIFSQNKVKWLLNTLSSLFQRDYFGILSKYFIKTEVTLPSVFEQTLNKSKKEYNKFLTETLQDKKIVLMVDEVDRLHEKKDLLNVFKVIRYTASFDNVFVITAIDLLQTISKFESDSEYIQKIFNIKYELPRPNENIFFDFYQTNVFNKIEKYIDKKIFENILTIKSTRTEKSLLEIIPTYRVIKNSFNETYIFIKYLHETRPDDWQDYISFEFIFILNILKSMDISDYMYLVVENNLLKELEMLGKEDKINSEQKKILSKNTHDVLWRLKKIFIGRVELYLEIYKNYDIYDYNINYKKYIQYTQNLELIDSDIKQLHIKDYKTNFLLNLVKYIYTDKENQQKILDKTLDILLSTKDRLDYQEVLELIVITMENPKTLVIKENKEMLIKLFKDKELGNEFISLVFDNQKLMFFGKQIEQDVVMYLFEEYLKSIDCKNSDEKELEEKLKELFLRNLTLANIDHYEKENLNDEEKQELQFSNNIRKIIIDNCLKYKKDVVTKFLIASMPFENVKNFFEENNLDIKELLNNRISYEVKLSNNDGSYSHKYLSGKEIEGKLK